MRKETLSLVGTVIASSFAASCCLGPTLFVLFGTTSGSLGFFTALLPLKPLFLGVAALCLGYAFCAIYLRPPSFECVGAFGPSGHINKVVFWLALGLFVVAILYPVVLASVVQ